MGSHASLVRSRIHYPSDVIAGGMIAVAVNAAAWALRPPSRLRSSRLATRDRPAADGVARRIRRTQRSAAVMRFATNRMLNPVTRPLLERGWWPRTQAPIERPRTHQQTRQASRLISKREERLDAGNLKRALHGHGPAQQREAVGVRARATLSREYQSNAGRVDERQTREVENDRLGVGRLDALELLLGVGRGGKVELSFELDGVEIAVALGADREDAQLNHLRGAQALTFV
jgi:hypothetical protein